MTRIVTTTYRYQRPAKRKKRLRVGVSTFTTFWLRTSAAAALALSSPLAFAQEAVPGDRVYEVHSEAQGSCPSLNWHMVASPDGVLTGMVAWDNRKVVAMVTGAITPLVRTERFGKPLGDNPQSRTFGGIASEVGGQNRVANISGSIEANGWLNANIQGPGFACEHIKVPLFVPAAP
jgi:hypothetical protein